MADSKKYDGSQWEHSLRKLTTATEAVENPLYSDGTAITSYTIKGNEEHTGTPSPQNPVMPNGVGERTANLLEMQSGTRTRSDITFTINDNKSVTITGTATALTYSIFMGDGAINNNLNAYSTPIFRAGDSLIFSTDTSVKLQARYTDGTYYNEIPNNRVITLAKDVGLIYVQVASGETRNITIYPMIRLSTSTLSEYEPYGYKIPILNGQTTTPIYLGSTSSTRQIKKLVLDGTETWYINNQGTVNAFFSMVLANPLNVNLGISTHFIFKGIYTSNDDVGFYVTTTGELRIRPDNVSSMTKSDFTTWLSQQYANGTPVTVWYVLATETTGIVNEPLRKIGDYADTVSGITIPTIAGANTISVGTTVQPSEFSATWTGWHNAEVKEKSENLFDTFDIVGQVPSISNGQLITYNGSTTSLILINSGNITVTKPPTALLYLLLYAADMSYIGYVQNSTDANFYGSSVTGYENAKYCRLRIDRTTGLNDIQIMLNTGSTALPYEPYWK